MSETWLPWCTRKSGDTSRTGYFLKKSRKLTEIRYQVNHSAEGWAAFLMPGSRPGASWSFSNLQNGVMLQHYPLEAITWTSGGRRQNIDGLAVEHEGMTSQPLNVVQVANDRRLFANLQRLCPNLRDPVYLQGFREHDELTNGATSCPSGRIQSLYDSYKAVSPPTPPEEEDDDMAKPIYVKVKGRRFTNSSTALAYSTSGRPRFSETTTSQRLLSCPRTTGSGSCR